MHPPLALSYWRKQYNKPLVTPSPQDVSDNRTDEWVQRGSEEHPKQTKLCHPHVFGFREGKHTVVSKSMCSEHLKGRICWSIWHTVSLSIHNLQQDSKNQFY